MTPLSKKVAKGRQTRARLIAVAKDLFAANGYAATSIDEVIRSAEVTRGALYHHFAGKEDLFEAAFEQVQTELIAAVQNATLGLESPLARLKRAVSAFLERCVDPSVQRIILRDGLAVLGWDRWYEIDARFALGLITATLKQAMRVDEIARQPVEPLAHVLLGAMNHAGLYIAGAEDPHVARRRIDRALERVLEGLADSARP